jgi:hypothetical protein
MSAARPVVMTLLVLAFAWLAWSAAGWLVERFGLPAGALLQQATLVALALTLLDRLLARFLPADAPGDHHG